MSERGDGVEQADVHVLPAARALARQQRQQDALEREHARGNVRDGHAQPHRRTVGRAGDAHESAFGLNHRVVARLRRAAAPSDRSRRSTRR